MVSSQSVNVAKTAQLESNAYRAIMPGIIALAIAIIIIVMFSYFIDLYYVRPVLKITEGAAQLPQFQDSVQDHDGGTR